MKEFKIKPLNVLGGRKLNFLPIHVNPIALKTGYSSVYQKSMIISWVESNLKGRYFIGTLTKLENDRIVQYEAIGFEEPHESTLFLLGYPGQK